MPSSLDIGAGQALTKLVESFHAWTTNRPAAATDVSDCPSARRPAGVMSSARLAAFTLPGSPARRWTAALPPRDGWKFGPKQKP